MNAILRALSLKGKFEMVTPEGQTFSLENNPLATPNPVSAPKQKQRVSEANPNLSMAEKLAFWQSPIASVDDLAQIMGTTAQGIGRLDLPVYRVGSFRFVRPVELAHSWRALRAEGGAK